MYGLIPGFMNSKYEHPLGGTEINISPGRRNNVNIYAEKLATLQTTSSNFSPQGTQQSPVNANQVQERQSVPNYAISSHYSPEKVHGKTFNKLNQTFEVADLSPNYRSMTNMNGVSSPTYKAGHNPLTNPLPYNNQNPYIAREINNIAGRRPYFANMATNNLIG